MSRLYDYESLLKVGQIFSYEEGAITTPPKMPRWNYKGGIGWIDNGRSGSFCLSEIISLQDDTVIFSLYDVPLHNYIIPLSKNTPQGRGAIYDPLQWTWDGFFAPQDGWESLVPIVKQKICSCGAEAFARLTNQPVTGHGFRCEKWTKNPYQ